MYRVYIRWMGISSLILFLTASCGLLGGGSPTVGPGDAAFTQAFQTLDAQLTQLAQVSTQTAEEIPPTNTPPPTVEKATNFPVPTRTPLPISTTTPVHTPTPVDLISPTPATSAQTGGIGSGTGAAASLCNQARFVEDVTVPDDTKFPPGATFTKTWRVKNTGTCTWSQDYSLVFVKGEQMNGPDEIPIPEQVKSGEEVDISVTLIAPGDTGEYQGNWMLADENGTRFGTGSNALGYIWVKILVREISSGIVYDFAANYCSANWESGAGKLSCPGSGTEPSGFVKRLENPELENRKENEPALWTNPEMKTNGWITGAYPAVRIRAGDRFLADIGCLDDSSNCDVIFQLNYRIGDGAVKNLGEWPEIFDGKVTRVDIDLSALEGKLVEFILTVQANGSHKDDAAFWLVPQISRD